MSCNSCKRPAAVKYERFNQRLPGVPKISALIESVMEVRISSAANSSNKVKDIKCVSRIISYKSSSHLVVVIFASNEPRMAQNE